MARRGEQLRDHILWTAKELFLELGFERSSMDEVAARAATSKRSVYAHFESKEKLWLAVIEFVRGLFLGKVKTPGDYAAEPAEALALFCGRYLEILLYRGSIQMCRISLAEAERFPQGAAGQYDVMFTEIRARLGTYLAATFGLPPAAAEDAGERLLGRILYPRLPKALFGIDPLAGRFDEEGLSPLFDLAPIRRAVAELLESLPP